MFLKLFLIANVFNMQTIGETVTATVNVNKIMIKKSQCNLLTVNNGQIKLS